MLYTPLFLSPPASGLRIPPSQGCCLPRSHTQALAACLCGGSKREHLSLPSVYMSDPCVLGIQTSLCFGMPTAPTPNNLVFSVQTDWSSLDWKGAGGLFPQPITLASLVHAQYMASSHRILPWGLRVGVGEGVGHLSRAVLAQLPRKGDASLARQSLCSSLRCRHWPGSQYHFLREAEEKRGGLTIFLKA